MVLPYTPTYSRCNYVLRSKVTTTNVILQFYVDINFVILNSSLCITTLLHSFTKDHFRHRVCIVVTRVVVKPEFIVIV